MTTRRVALYALAIIFLANFLNYMDRMLVSAQEEQISKAFGLTDAQFGWLWSLFTIGYLACAVPIGYLADHYHRPRIFAVCVIIWSAATIATGMASSQLVLYVSRFLIGVGEAGCLIVGPALLSDYFSQQTRGRALSTFYIGQPVGGAAGYALPGELLHRGYAWTTSFYVAGLPGFLIAALLLVMRDPPRGNKDEGAGHHGHGASLAQYLSLLKNWTLLLIILAQAFSVIILIPLLHFGKRFLLEKHHLDERGATLVMLFVMVAGIGGMAVSGVIGDRLARRFQGAYALLAAFGYLLSLPFLFVAFWTDDYDLFRPALTIGSFFLFLCMPAVNTQIANVVHPTQRATAWALAVMILHLLGDTLAPPVFGYFSKEMGRQQAFEVFSIALALASLCCFVAAKTARRDIERFAGTA